MKKSILPIIFAVLSFILFKSMNPQIAATGIALAILVGLGIGAGLNKLVFKEKKQEE